MLNFLFPFVGINRFIGVFSWDAVTVNIYTVDLPVDLRWTTTNKTRAKGLHGAALENYLINWSCDVGEGLEMA